MSSASAAVDVLDPQAWKATPAEQRLQLLHQVRDRLGTFVGELASSDAAMKNERLGEDLFSLSASKMATAVPIANTLTACIDLYEHIVRTGEMPKPISVVKVADRLWDCHVFPFTQKEGILYGTRNDVVRVKGEEPIQINPMDQPPGIIAVLGAGNYTSSLEMVKAMFLDGKAVVHKPHQINIQVDKVWAKVFEPLVEHNVLSFLEEDPTFHLNTDPRIGTIYFTGGSGTASKIMAGTTTPVISECGGNNPCIVVPGDRPWTAKELKHQAMVFVTLAKMNGGAVCGRAQTIVMSKQWEQREQFLAAIKTAISEDTFAAGTYYPGSDRVFERFQKAHPAAELFEPEGGKFKSAKFMMITDLEEDSYAVENEAFCQIVGEVPLDVPANAGDFLAAATTFCNEKLLGTLGCYIVVDEDTKKANGGVLDKAVTELSYGGIGINVIPPMVFLNPFLTWYAQHNVCDFSEMQLPYLAPLF